jgi:hypothetical protein
MPHHPPRLASRSTLAITAMSPSSLDPQPATDEALAVQMKIVLGELREATVLAARAGHPDLARETMDFMDSLELHLHELLIAQPGVVRVGDGVWMRRPNRGTADRRSRRDAHHPAAEADFAIEARPTQVSVVPAAGVANVDTVVVVADGNEPVSLAEPARHP